MPKFKFYVTEIYSDSIVVEAENEQEAYEKVEEMCNTDGFDVMSVEHFSERNIELDDYATRWLTKEEG